MEKKPLRERLKAQARYEIFEAAEKLFAKKGFHLTNVQDIAKEVGFSTGSFYQHFPGKEELYSELLKYRTSEFLKTIKEGLERQSDPVDQIETYIETVTRFCQTHIDSFRIYINETSGFQWEIKNRMGKEIYASYRTILKILGHIFEKGIKKGVFIKIDPEHLALSLTGILNSLITYGSETGDELNPKKMSALIKKIFFEPVLTLKK